MTPRSTAALVVLLRVLLLPNDVVALRSEDIQEFDGTGGCNKWKCRENAPFEGYSDDEKKCVNKLCDEDVDRITNCCALVDQMKRAGVSEAALDFSGLKGHKAQQRPTLPSLGHIGISSAEEHQGSNKATVKKPAVELYKPIAPKQEPKECKEWVSTHGECGCKLAPLTIGGKSLEKVCPKACVGAPQGFICGGTKFTSGGTLPCGQEGDVALVQPCAPGTICDYKCNGGQWAAVKQDPAPKVVSSPTSATDCSPTSFTYTLSGNSRVYKLPGGVQHAAISHDCAFGRLTAGQVHFHCTSTKCQNGEPVCWSVSANTCKVPGTVCPDIQFLRSLAGHEHMYELKAAGAGEISRPCMLGPYTKGVMKFKCTADGDWEGAGHTCKDPSVVCVKTLKSVGGAAGPGTKLRWTLEAGPAGPRTVECGEGYKGKVVFNCDEASNKWIFQQTESQCELAA